MAGSADAAPKATTGVNPSLILGLSQVVVTTFLAYDIVPWPARRTPVSRRVEATPCPSFAMVCLERRRVTGCFPRDRGRKACLSTAARQARVAFGRPVSTLGPMEKRKSSSVHSYFGAAGIGAIVAGLHGGRVAPREK